MYPKLQNLSSKSPLTLAIYALIGIGAIIYVLNPMTVTVTGSGEVSVPASNVTVSFNLMAQDASSPQNAIANVNAKALAMRTFLKSRGITEDNIAQSQVTAVPTNLVTPGVNGYQATISMAAKTTQVSEVSTLISNLYAQGAQVVAQPILSVDNPSKIDQDAFNTAMDDAKKQATRMGLSNWKILRKVVAISQVTSPSTSTSTVSANLDVAGNGVFKVVKAVSVTYRMW